MFTFSTELDDLKTPIFGVVEFLRRFNLLPFKATYLF